MLSDNIKNQALRCLPPPRLVGLPIRAVPPALTQNLVAATLRRHLNALIDPEEFEQLAGKCIAIEVTDLVVTLRLSFDGEDLQSAPAGQSADATVRGRAADLLMLAGQIEDPDTLFFERRLQVVGDTATGLLVRNLLDRIDPQQLPLALRIVLNRGGRLGARLHRLREADTAVA